MQKLRTSVLALACSLLFGSARAAGDVDRLTAERVVAIAAERSPLSRLGRAAVLEARGRTAAARAWTGDPTLEILREVTTPTEEGARTEVELTLPFGVGLERGPRITEAEAAEERDVHLASWSVERAIAEGLRAYYALLAAEAQRDAATERVAIAADLARIADERFHAGDISRLESLVAVVERSRALADSSAATAEVSAARRALARALGLPPGSMFTLVGELGDRTVLDAAIAGGSRGARSDVRAAEKELAAASAGRTLARRSVFPRLSLRASAEHDPTDDVALVGVAATLPLFDRAQAARGEALGRHERARAELDERRATAEDDAAASIETYERAVASLREIETNALPRALEAALLAHEGYEAGKLELASLLLVRSIATETRRTHVDRLLTAALAGIEVALATGGFRTERTNP